MAATEVSAYKSPLDEAHGQWLAGDRDAALRIGIAILQVGEQPLGAVALLATILIDEERTVVASEAILRLVDGWIRRGDLPAATAASHLADGAGEDGAKLRRAIAAAFASGSPRLGEVPAAPPPLPTKADLAPALLRQKGAELRDHAEEALQTWLGTDDLSDPQAKVPVLPLFSSLSPDPLARLLGAFVLREVPVGHEIIRQGEEGREAHVIVHGLLEVARHADGGKKVMLATLGPGAIFGEMALVSQAPRAAAVAAIEPSVLLSISRDALESLAGEQPAVGRELGRFCRQRMLANLARHSAILQRVGSEDRADLMGRFETVSFEPGAHLVRQGQEAQGLLLIASGGVEVVGKDAEGDRLCIAALGPGDVVGEISLVLRRPAMADVVALHSTVALRLSRDRFQQAIQDHPGLLNELYGLATKREEETRSVVAQPSLDVEDVVLV